jgi:hypothetical protein
MVQTSDSGRTRAAATSAPERHELTILLFAVFMALLVYGLLSGNVFETYHNGSTL